MKVSVVAVSRDADGVMPSELGLLESHTHVDRKKVFDRWYVSGPT